MKWKKFFAVAMAATMVASVSGCGKDEKQSVDTSTADGGQTTTLSYADIDLAQSYSDVKATITVLNHRTDLDSADYKGKKWSEYIADFNEKYPNITVEMTTDTNYADDALTHLQSGDYETVMMIPAVDKADLSNYFISYGDLDTMKNEINYATAWEYDNQVYGVPSTATAQGIVYNKKVFADAGIEEMPKTPDEFIADLKLIKENTDAIPLYTNYAAGWTMGAWDAYIGINATGDVDYMNKKFIHEANPFRDRGDNTHAYAVYKILYDAVAEGLTEDDYSTTDWEGSKGMLNNGQIGCMVLGSWAYPQMEAAGDNADDVGYMAFPISVDGKQYSVAGPDYSYGINVNASDDEKQAAMIFVKWMTEMSGFSYNEDGLPIDVNSVETKLTFEGVELLEENPAVTGEEDILNLLNSDSELNVNSGGDIKVQSIIEHATNQDMTFDEIMDSWNASWTDAQEVNGIEVTE